MDAGRGSIRNGRSGTIRPRSKRPTALRRIVAVVCAIAAGLTASTLVLADGASANTSPATNVPYSCTTNGFGDQTATYSATITDTIDPAAVGNSVTYRFVVPFAQQPPPVTATYQGGTVRYRVPAGLTVTSVSAPPKAGSNLTSTASVQGDTVVMTSTGNQPIDGGNHPTPDLVVTGTITNAAAGPGVAWKTPYQITANVNAQFVGQVVATCAPNNPNTVIATTTVPAAPTGPVAINQTVAVASGAAKAVTLTATDSDNTAAQLTFITTTQPTHGTLTGTVPSLTYTSSPNYVGADSFTFTVTDPDGLTGTGTITLRVFSNNAIDNVAPVITLSSPQNGAVLSPGQVVAAGFSCTDAITAVEDCSGTVAAGAPVSTTLGAHVFTVDARDTAGNLARTTVGYRVIDPAIVGQSYNTANAIPVTCNPQLPIGSQTVPATVSAPLQVGTGRNLTMRLSPGQGSVPALVTRSNVVFTMAVPVNGTALSASLVPNTGTANARASASATVTNGKAILTIAGPIAGSTTAATAYTPPSLDVVIRAGTTPNVDVQTKLEAYKETDVVSGVGQVPITRTCTAGNPSAGQPNPVLTRTRIIDTTPPIVTLTGPVSGGLFALNAAVPAQFACADDRSLSACVGTTANGANLDTSTAGVKTLTATAVDASGNFGQKLASVRVVPVEFTTRFEDDALPLLDAAAAFYATDRAGVLVIGTYVAVTYLAPNPDLVGITPPPNTGPTAVTAVYQPVSAQVLAAAAAQLHITAEQLQTIGVSLFLYFFDLAH